MILYVRFACSMRICVRVPENRRSLTLTHLTFISGVVLIKSKCSAGLPPSHMREGAVTDADAGPSCQSEWWTRRRWPVSWHNRLVCTETVCQLLFLSLMEVIQRVYWLSEVVDILLGLEGSFIPWGEEDEWASVGSSWMSLFTDMFLYLFDRKFSFQFQFSNFKLSNGLKLNMKNDDIRWTVVELRKARFQ